MHNSKSLYCDFVNRITIAESDDEIATIAYMVFEEVFNLSKSEVLTQKEVDDPHTEVIENIISRINQHEPIQYILGKAQFFGRTFAVAPAVLIPRPETEELVLMVKQYVAKGTSQSVSILDVGTGSGCIAITLALELKHAHVTAVDVSQAALDVASLNARMLQASVDFIHQDILACELTFRPDIMVSNPPYIPEKEKEQMPANVKVFEPASALFVPDEDPLIFYKALASHAQQGMNNGSLLAVEVHESRAEEVKNLFTTRGFRNLAVIQDIFGKNRIVKGIVSS